MQTPWLSCKETEPVSLQFLNPGTMQGDKLLTIITPHRSLSYHTENGDEEGKLAGELKDGSAKQGTVHKQILLCALQKIHQGLMIQDGVQDLIDAVEGTCIPNLPAVLPILRFVTGSDLQPAKQSSYGDKGFQGHAGSRGTGGFQHTCNLSNICSSQSMSETGGCKLETSPPTIKLLFCMVCPIVHCTSKLLAIRTRVVQIQSQLRVWLQVTSSACTQASLLLGFMMSLDLCRTHKYSKGK